MENLGKRWTRRISPMLFAGLVLLACGGKSPDPEIEEHLPELPVVIMSAFEPEWTRLLEAAEVADTIVGGSTYKIGTLAEKPVILMLTGIGVDRAERATRDVIERFETRGIVFTGMAGGIHPLLRIGDVAVPARWARHDVAGDTTGAIWYDVDEEMLDAARKIAPAVPLDRCTAAGDCVDGVPSVTVGGNGVSGREFISDDRERRRIWEFFGADVVDMETAEAARVSHEEGVPFIAFRALSDLAGRSSRQEFETFYQLAADNAASVAEAFLNEWEGTPVAAEAAAR